jgi:hypothetical protein
MRSVSAVRNARPSPIEVADDGLEHRLRRLLPEGRKTINSMSFIALILFRNLEILYLSAKRKGVRAQNCSSSLIGVWDQLIGPGPRSCG